MIESLRMKKTTDNAPRKLVVVGGGFAGISLVRHLARDPHYQVTLISDSDHFRYYPLLYSAATGHTRVTASFPIRSLLADKPEVAFVHARLKSIDTEKHIMRTEDGGEYPYDTAALAIGMVTSYFNIPGLQEYSLGTKSIEQALQLRRHLHSEMLERAKRGYTCVVVGGGPTGVELSAAMVAYLRRVARRHGLPEEKVKVYLVESGPRVLRFLPESGSARVARRLAALGVTVMAGNVVKSQDADSVLVGDKTIRTNTVVWTAGVSNNPLFSGNEAFAAGERGRIKADPYLMATPDVYVLGDNVATPYSGLAETAVSNGKYLAKQLRRIAAGKRPHPYHPHNPISVVPVGEGWAVASFRRLVLTGRLASWLRRAADLIGFMDVAPMPMAISLWLSDHAIEDDCPECRRRGH